MAGDEIILPRVVRPSRALCSRNTLKKFRGDLFVVQTVRSAIVAMDGLTVVALVAASLAVGCSSRRVVVRDERTLITDAAKWEPESSQDDSITGIAVRFVDPAEREEGAFWVEVDSVQNKLIKHLIKPRTPSQRRHPHPVDPHLLAIPSRHRRATEYEHDEAQGPIMDPSSGQYHVRTISYVIKNESMSLVSEDSSSNLIKFPVPPGTYLLQCSPSGYVSKRVKVVTISHNDVSIVTIELYPMVPFVY